MIVRMVMRMPAVPEMKMSVPMPGQLANDVEEPKGDQCSTGDPREERPNSIAQRDPEPGYDQAKSRAKNGEVDEVKWLEIDGLKGVEFREANPEKPDGFRRLQWMAYRKYAGQVQLVNLMLSSSGAGFPKHQDEMYGVMYSTKIVH